MVPRTLARWLMALLCLFALGCRPTHPEPTVSGEGITPEKHTWFPIATGAAHGMGRAIPEGAIGCDSCHAPTADSFKQFECTGCHIHEPTLTDKLHLNVADYGNDSASCYRCHPAGEKVAFDHAGITGGCAGCHEVAAPFAALPVAGFTHPAMGGADCGACHGKTTWKGATGAPVVAAFDPLASITVNTLIPRYSGTTISKLSPQAVTLTMAMNHSAPEVPAAANSACGNCHSDAATGSFYPGTLHSSLANLKLAQPAACSSCHAELPAGFVGPLATTPARVPASGEMKHDAVAWTNGAPTTTGLVTDDCGVCHSSPSQTLVATWATGRAGTTPAQYHASLTAAGKPQPTSCVDCHANSRPNARLTSANSTLAAPLEFDHASAAGLADCGTCHAASAASSWTSWAGGKLHLPGDPNPKTCLPCHAGERPTSTASWTSPNWSATPFDYVTNSDGITHGGGQDCAMCHAGPGLGGAWGGTQSWKGGSFAHGPNTPSATSCILCHETQRPDLQPGTTPAAMATLLGFDHSINGTGECAACHQATVTAGTYVNYLNPSTRSLPNGDWKGGVTYPGSTFASSSTQFVTLTEISLFRSGPYNLVTSMSSAQSARYNGMLHVSAALPPQLNAGPTSSPDSSKCWHCHTNTNGTVTSFVNGQYHTALTNYSATPGGTVTPFPQPTSNCGDCHDPMLPQNIVEKTASNLVPMDHSAPFTQAVNIGGTVVTKVSQLDCSVCHHGPGSSWADGVFHANIGTAVPQDCVSCHYPLMADPVKSDVTSSTTYTMQHDSPQLTFQACQTCHPTALSKGATTPIAGTLWKTGLYHSKLSAQPTKCVDCHAISEPAPNASTQSSWLYTLALGGTTTNGAQWMNHGSIWVAGKDCVDCHAADAKQTGSAWSKSVQFHAAVPTANTCSACHGLTNGGGSVPGTKNNLPAGLTNSTMVTSASSSTGVPAGTLDQITHADINVSARDCNACHTQVGSSTATGVQGKEWAQASFHINTTAPAPLVMNGTTGRCSNCHLNVKPGPSYTGQDHSSFTSTAGTQDCSACHSWPGTGTSAAPNWLGASAMPPYITVGGFAIPQPPATTATTQLGINNLPHPAVASGTPCTTCHVQSGGGKNAFGYDHLSTLINSNCNSCHEYGSNLIGTPWNNATAVASGAGDTRSITLASVVASYKGNSRTITYPNHFYPVDCAQCHVVPAGNGFVTTGTAYRTIWKFPHTETKMTNPTTCVICHPNGIPD